MNLETLLMGTKPDAWTTRQAIVFDWYDGPREGICALAHPHVEFLFSLADERSQEDDLDDRFFRLKEVPPGTVQQILSLLAPLGTPQHEVWIPVWKFPNDATRSMVETKLKEIEASAKTTNLIIWTRDMKRFLGCWQWDPKQSKHQDLSSAIDHMVSQI